MEHLAGYKTMGAFGPFLRRTTTGYLHWCAGCEEHHHISTDCKNHCGAQWSFNGNPDNPTFAPSINMPGICHYFIQNGSIQYLGDSRHKLSGQTVPMTPLASLSKDDSIDDDGNE